MSKTVCKCEHCTAYDLYRWATIMECGCGCHDEDVPSEHDNLCCPFPNGKRKDNPHKELLPASSYKKILNEWYRKNCNYES